ncbi:hypothetical protein XpiCFBP4643_11605 [Xanthomonas pisi]|uniref:Uncharacterized protein n=1 Tax=Xanthomonas pisi TaxID=56457 RepID=A0A2S7D334_9XANT|nr:hypothetical protein XpiCFBP4643_11605 [Xanthomonas pisi]
MRVPWSARAASAGRGAERGWGEGTRRSLRTTQTPPGFAHTLIRPCGAPSPEGRRDNDRHLQSARAFKRSTVRPSPCGARRHCLRATGARALDRPRC